MSSAFTFGQAPAPAASQPQWYYYLQNDPHGAPDGWYRYEVSIETTVESFYQGHQTQVSSSSARPMKKARQLLPVTARSGYQYEVDFQAMTQRNTTSSKSRPIDRTTNGFPPDQQQQQQQQQHQPVVYPPVAAVAAAPFPVYQAPPAFQPGFQHNQQDQHQQPPVHVIPTAPFAFQSSAPVQHSSAPTLPLPAAAKSSLRADGVDATRYQNAMGGEDIIYTAPEKLHEVRLDETKIFEDMAAPTGKPGAANNNGDEKKQSDSNYANASHDDDCVICIDSLWKADATASDPDERVVSIKNCSHRFHYACIHEALTKGGGKCPLCSKPVEQEEGASKTSKGKCPSGTMTYQVNKKSCSGHPNVDTIRIDYRIPSAIQKSFHDFPGTAFSGANRTAYLPATSEGWDILWRMQYSFAHGLMFMVGTSLTTSQPNVVTWASIHNKTSMNGGAYGYPDDSYFARSNDEMNGLGIPTANTCREWLKKLTN